MFDRITKMGYTIKSVGGNFICSSNKLTSLEHAPKSVGGDFNCFNNPNLTSLKGAPLKIGRDGDFKCYNNNLTSLEHAPLKVGGDFYCNNNNLTSLKGAPLKIGRDGNFEIRLSDHEDKHYYGNRYNLKINEMRIKDIFDSIEEIILKETKNKIKFIF